jgi:hypothetical protein
VRVTREQAAAHLERARRPFAPELKGAFRSPTLSASNRPLTLKTISPFVSQVILSICAFRTISPAFRQKCADRRNARQFRRHLELSDFGDFGSEREDDFSQFCGKSQAAQRAVTF